MKNWLSGNKKDLHSKKQLEAIQNNNDCSRRKKIQNAKNLFQRILWYGASFGAFLFFLFSILISGIFLYNKFFGIKSDSIDFMFYEWLKLVIYGIVSCVTKDTVKKQFES